MFRQNTFSQILKLPAYSHDQEIHPEKKSTRTCSNTDTERHRSRGVACAPPAVGQLAQLPLVLDLDEDSECGSLEHGQAALGSFV